VSPAIGQWFDFDFSQPFPLSEHNSLYLENGRPRGAENNTTANVDGCDETFYFRSNKRRRAGLDNTEVKGISFKVTIGSKHRKYRYLIAADGAKGPMAKWFASKSKRRLGGAC